MSRTSTQALLAALVLASVALGTGCEAIKDLRRKLRGDETPAESPGTAGLRVEVEPQDGITVLLDEVRVASVSPFVSRTLAAGTHRLEVRAMGYYPVALPVTLEANKVVTVPVALRPRPNEPAPTRTPPPPRARSPEPPPSAAPALPDGVRPIVLTLAPTPEAPVQLDRVNVAGRQVRLERVAGELAVGAMSLHYMVGGADLLTLSIPNDDATWTKDGAALKPGTGFKLHNGVVRLRRSTAEGDDQSLLIRR
ncbi:MAG: PEGA domain-containing protein [Deltaproteobacteria bacterium]|nr:PEGA domain-containing protein [Deltaproteobacteria bacterium]